MITHEHSQMGCQGRPSAEAKPVMFVENRLHEIFWGAGLEKQTFKMTGPAATAANLVWRGKAMSMLAANFFMVALLVVLGALLFKVSLLKAVLLFIDAFVAFPVLFELTDLPESKKYIWQIVRLVAAIAIMLVVAILV